MKLVDPDGDSLKLVGSDKYFNKALEQMNSKATNISFHINDDGFVTYSGEAKTDMEKYMVDILNSSEVIVNLSVQGNNYYPKPINNKYGTAFMGNAIRNDGTKVDAFQTINVLLSEKYDFLCKNSGNMIWHEISEAYEGGLISLSQNTNAKVAYLNEKNSIYETAHNRAGVFFPGNIDSDPFMTYFYFNRDFTNPSIIQTVLRSNYRYEK